MPKDTSDETPTSPPATTELPPDDYIKYGKLILAGVSCHKAAAQVWPTLKRPAVKATKVNKDPRLTTWLRAQKETNQQKVRQITASLNADYESRITALAQAFNDPDVKMRERLQIHDKLSDAEGRKKSSPREGTGSANIYAIAFGTGTTGTMGQSDPRRRLPDLRRGVPQDTDEGTWPATAEVVATPAADVAAPAGPDSTT